MAIMIQGRVDEGSGQSDSVEGMRGRAVSGQVRKWAIGTVRLVREATPVTGGTMRGGRSGIMSPQLMQW
jgi:hypothetical protein